MPFIGFPAATPQTAPIRIAVIKKKPPASGDDFAMRRPWQTRAGCSSPVKTLVNVSFTLFVGHRERRIELSARHGFTVHRLPPRACRGFRAHGSLRRRGGA